MSIIDGYSALVQEANAFRQVDAIIAEQVDELDQQLAILDALYEMFDNRQYAEVVLLLRAFRGEWV